MNSEITRMGFRLVLFPDENRDVPTISTLISEPIDGPHKKGLRYKYPGQKRKDQFVLRIQPPQD